MVAGMLIMRIFISARYFSHLYQTALSLSKKPQNLLYVASNIFLCVCISKPSNLTFINSKVTCKLRQVKVPLRDRAIGQVSSGFLN